MLVLTRRVGEEILINGEIRVVVLAVLGGRVRLGIAAPPSVRVRRSEARVEEVEIPHDAFGPGRGVAVRIPSAARAGEHENA
jgi:carbon storage regulator